MAAVRQVYSPPKATRYMGCPGTTTVVLPMPTLSPVMVRHCSVVQPMLPALVHSFVPAPVAVHTPSLLASTPAPGVVRIEGRAFERTRELGRGSFGVVWEARERRGPGSAELGGQEDGPVVALKWSTPARPDLFEACLLEAEVLKQLGATLPERSDGGRRIPRHVAHGTISGDVAGPMGRATAGYGHVLLAMSKLEGQPLDQWLYAVDEQRLKTIRVEQLLHGPMQGSRVGSCDLAGASSAAAALLTQMAPVFAALEGIAVHRDVSAHNFLVRSGPAEEGSELQFAVLDFGLAVRTHSWKQEWHRRNIAGDPRYFAPAAWMLLAFGHKYVEGHPDQNFMRQYRDRADHFAFGVLTVEVLFALWQCGSGRPEDPELEGPGRGTPEEVCQQQSLLQARRAWHAYWADAMVLFQSFHAEGAVATRQALARSEAISQLVAKLRTLCAALRHAARLQPVGAQVASVFFVAAGLLECGSAGAPMSWRDVEGLLGAAAAKEGSPAADGPLPDTGPRWAGSSSPSASRTCAAQSVTIAVGTAEPRSSPAGTPSWSGRSLRRGSTALPLHTAADCPGAEGREKDAVGGIKGASPAASPSSPRKATLQTKARFSHRRVWTVDEAVSLRRNVGQVGLHAEEPMVCEGPGATSH